jgi:hypothetical protein
VRTRRGLHLAVLFLPPDRSPKDLFENDAPFFPADEAGAIKLFARASVVSIVIEATDDAPESLAALGVPYVTRNIAVHFESGETITGALRSLGGPTRTLDLLNDGERSFAVHAGSKIHHVAKAHVDHIEELP